LPHPHLNFLNGILDDPRLTLNLKDRRFKERFKRLANDTILRLQDDSTITPDEWLELKLKVDSSAEEEEIPLNRKLLAGSRLLAQFNYENGFKNLTHKWEVEKDFDINSEIQKGKNVFDNFTKGRDAQVAPKLFSLINTFIFEKQFSNRDKPVYWTDANVNRHNEGFSHPQWIDWSEKQVDRMKSHPWECEDFLKIIIAFKHTIRVYSPVLTDIIDDSIKMTLGTKIPVQIDPNVDFADFYCFVPALKQALESMFSLIKDCIDSRQHVSITYEYNLEPYTDPQNRQYRVFRLYIRHHNSYPNKTFDHFEARWKTYAGDMGSIAKNLLNVCDWSVQTKAPIPDGYKYFQANLLRISDETPYIEDIEPDSVVGFTHILTFYNV
jgi:hypothetical protein